mgnify:CR=1 FL=1|jgi:hypothetical protein|tara:strand:- start:2705 stop:3079 length:375 start_codon:yes stop_codon:yes gene_type:complete
MKLLTVLTLAVCFTILPSCSTAQETWKKGDKVAAFFICKEEKDIMAIALADSKGIQNFSKLLIEKQITQGCVPLRPPALFIVDDVIGNYTDYKGQETAIMKIISPKNTLLTGYIVAVGIPDKGI